MRIFNLPIDCIDRITTTCDNTCICWWGGGGEEGGDIDGDVS